MAIDFSQLKKNRKDSLAKLSSELTKMNAGTTPGADDRFWRPEVDKAGNGSAIIRFLPAPPNEDLPFIRIWDHAFKGPTGQWYIEKSLTTIGQQDPVSEMNSKLWNSGIEKNKELVRKERKRRLHYTSNILVINDPANKANEGKVFLFNYGKKIFDKLNDLMHPTFEGEEAVNPFCAFDGVNFRLKIRNVEGYRNYDKSDFTAPSPIAASDKEIEAIWTQAHSLAGLVDPKEFKSYADLARRLALVVGEADAGPTASAPAAGRTRPAAAMAEDDGDSAPWSAAAVSSSDDEDDGNLSFFDNISK